MLVLSSEGLNHARDKVKPLANILSYSSPIKVGLIGSISQMRRLRRKAVDQLSQGHATEKWQRDVKGFRMRGRGHPARMCEGVTKEGQDPWRNMSLRRNLPWIGVGEGWGWADQVEGTAPAKAPRMKIPPGRQSGLQGESAGEGPGVLLWSCSWRPGTALVFQV